MPLVLPEDDPINHPAHYTLHPSGVECITITEHMGFNLGNAIKYVWRADLKGDELGDLRKAIWYACASRTSSLRPTRRPPMPTDDKARGGLIRPNGKLYRPRKVTCHAWVDSNDEVSGVLVLGTHNIDVAQPLADEAVRCWADGSMRAEPWREPGWYRDGYAYGERAWVDDPLRGRAGIMFEAVYPA